MASPLDIRLLSLACCGVDAAIAVRSWRERAGDPHPPTPAGPADVPVLVIAGTITRTQSESVGKALADLPPGGRVVAFGACAASGGPYWDSPVVMEGLRAVAGADDRLCALVDQAVVVPGCPPAPDALVAALADVAESSGIAQAGGDPE